VLRHSGNLLTVYANIEDVAFEKDQRVSQGQTIAKVRSDGAGFLHFEVREGFDSVDPIKYLN
jgi:murein DD-endopeptidase MepM/ murein hydrolase activator NlpD